MTRAVVFLAAVMSAASLGLFAQDTSAASPSATSPPTVTQTSSQNSDNTPATQGGSATNTSPHSAPAAHSSSPNTSTTRANRDIEGSAANDPGTSDGQLPQTSTILPLLGLIGLGSLVAGLFARR